MDNNDESKLLEKVLSKLTNDLDDRDREKIMNEDDPWQIRRLLLDMASEAQATERAKIEKLILEHKSCNQYHVIKNERGFGEDATCLDIILAALKHEAKTKEE